MQIPNWTGDWFWEDLGQFTTPTNRQHHGERSPPDFTGTGDCTALSWHWDRVISLIYAYLAAN
eukprot:331988-Heterocapsa_arctica.AAC.1